MKKKTINLTLLEGTYKKNISSIKCLLAFFSIYTTIYMYKIIIKKQKRQIFSFILFVGKSGEINLFTFDTITKYSIH